MYPSDFYTTINNTMSIDTTALANLGLVCLKVDLSPIVLMLGQSFAILESTFV